MHKMLFVLAVAAGLGTGLAGCAQTVVPFNPQPPRAALMKKPPDAPPPIAEGDELYDDNVKLRQELGRSYGQVRGLHGYIDTLLKKSKAAAQYPSLPAR
jgi:hypothetical protein